MNTLLVEHKSNKLVNNILHSNFVNIKVISAIINNNLYELYYQYKFNFLLLMSSSLNSEIFQFINEFSNSSELKIILYHDKVNIDLLDMVSDNLIHLIDIKHKYSLNRKQKNIRYMPLLVNKELFNTNNSLKQRFSSIVCFIDELESIPEDLVKYLYPNNKLPIRLFNNSNIQHPQNLGLLSELDKAVLLKQTEFYLAINDYYAPEALLSGCQVLDIKELDTMTVNKYKHKKDCDTYTKYLENILYEQK